MEKLTVNEAFSLATRASFMTTTIQSLPVELVTRVFVLGAHFDYPYTNSPFLFKTVQNTFYNSPPQDFQVTVSQICRRWRTIALRTSCLWSTLHFHEPLHIQRARVFLSRIRPESPATLDILISTVSQQDHIPNITLYLTELHTIFKLLVPYVRRWRSFHLKIRNNECKLVARQYLSSCGPGPNLETLQLYHFEDFGTSADLYIATYRPPVVIFNNSLPKIKNVSLIGVNLPWEKSPYLRDLNSLELALHLDNVRPAYILWDSMLRGSPDLERLFLHYSGPRMSDGSQANAWPSSAIWPSTHPTAPAVLDSLAELSLVDLDSEYVCKVLEGVIFPKLGSLTMDLSDQDYSNLVGMLMGIRTNTHLMNLHKPLPNLHLLVNVTLEALECSVTSFADFIKSLTGIRRLDIHFSRLCGGEGWKVFVASSDDQESVVTDEHDVVRVAEVSARNDLDVKRSHGTPTPSYTAEIVGSGDEEDKDGLEWRLPEGPIPKPFSSRGGSTTRARHLEPSFMSSMAKKRVRGILPKLEVFRLRGLDGTIIQSIIAARTRAGYGGHVMWVIPYNTSLMRRDVILTELVQSRCCFVQGKQEAVPIVAECIADDEESDGEEDEGEEDD